MKFRDKLKLYFLNKKLNVLKIKFKKSEKELEYKNEQLSQLDKKFESIPKTKSDRLNIDFLLYEINNCADRVKYYEKEINKVISQIGMLKYGKQCDCEECRKKNQTNRNSLIK